MTVRDVPRVRSQELIRACCASVIDEFHPQSPNIRMLGRARAPHLGQAGRGSAARMVLTSIATSERSAGKMPAPQSRVHWRASMAP